MLILREDSWPILEYTYVDVLWTQSVKFISVQLVYCPKAGPSLQAEKPRLQFCQRQVFHHKLRDQGCSFTRDLIGAEASHCFPHPTLSLASEQTLKDPGDTNEEAKRVDLVNWALWTSPEFATGVKHQFHQGF